MEKLLLKDLSFVTESGKQVILHGVNVLCRGRETGHIYPVLISQADWNKFKPLIYIGVNIFVFYGFPVSLVDPDAAFDNHNEIIELITAYLHLYNSLSAFLSVAEDSTMVRLS